MTFAETYLWEKMANFVRIFGDKFIKPLTKQKFQFFNAAKFGSAGSVKLKIKKLWPY